MEKSTESIIKELSLKYFDDVGLTLAIRPPSIERYARWLANGYHGRMDYLERHYGKKENPQKLLAGAKSWVTLALHYDTREPLSVEIAAELKKQKKGWIARYARHKDYHTHISDLHQKLIAEFKENFPGQEFLGCVDIQAVLERDAASRAGLGWIGKNTCLIHPTRGSFFFISEILTTLSLQPDKPVFDHCGTCTRCLDACPTGALESPRVLNSKKCISYWTIESKEAPPVELASRFGQNVFGCDICQDVCPWNSKARRQMDLPKPTVTGIVDLKEFVKLTPEEVAERTKQSSLSRAKPERLLESARNALKNC